MAATKEELETFILTELNEAKTIANSAVFFDAKLRGGLCPSYPDFIGALQSLTAAGMITMTAPADAKLRVELTWGLTAEGEAVVANGSPEALVFAAIPAEGIAVNDLKVAMGRTFGPGSGGCMKNKWIRNQNKVFHKIVESIVDKVQNDMKKVAGGEALTAKEYKDYSKRKMIVQNKRKIFVVAQGPDFTLERDAPLATDLTEDLLRSGDWKSSTFKKYNWDALGAPMQVGALHPLMKFKAEVRSVLLNMGFDEMPTNRYVESSFWNFDALFQPQQHPARDAHDTFFLTEPTTCKTLTGDYLETVRRTHEQGGFGSRGYRYDWKQEEAEKNILRTHTTAVSSRMLYQLANQEGGFKPMRRFSIDRVFRNETLDATHLAEFHQVEGFVADRNLTLGHLLGTIREFFERMGLSDITFKPAYNPYTEPSMEIFAYSKELKKTIEIGNSGMFRPEMLRPMGLPEDVQVIAWGLSLERPTMIKYGINNIRNIFGPKVKLDMIRGNPVCRFE
jgi:phenylalanyl-tRNA synthetase alpha chain